MFAHLKKITNIRSAKNKNEKYYSTYATKKHKNADYVVDSLAKTNEKVESHPNFFLETKTTTNEIVFASVNVTSQEITKLQGVEKKNVFIGYQPNGKKSYLVVDGAKLNVLSESETSKSVLENTLYDIEEKTGHFQITTDDKKAVEEVVRMMNEQLHNKNIDAQFDNEIVTKEQFISKITENITNDKNAD